jgi:hypothetical protein
MKLLLLIATLGLPLTIPSCLDRHPEMTIRAPAVFDRHPAGASIGHDDFFDVYLRIVDGTRSYEVRWAIEVQGARYRSSPLS